MLGQMANLLIRSIRRVKHWHRKAFNLLSQKGVGGCFLPKRPLVQISKLHGQEGGCGTRITIWKDIWVGETLLFTSFSSNSDIATDMWKLVFRWCDIPLFQASSWDSFNDWIISWHASKEKKHRFYVITTSVLCGFGITEIRHVLNSQTVEEK
ncbi:hypothetical protein Tco_0969889 [Tanacetum coccineum]